MDLAYLARTLAAPLIGVMVASHAVAAPPAVALVVELRQVEVADGAAGGYRAATGAQDALLPGSQVMARNGEKARLQVMQTIPMLWVPGVQERSANAGSGVSQGLHWLESGAGVSVLPRWPGGNKPVAVELDAQGAQVQAGSNADLPGQARLSFHTTLSMPLGQWVTVASTGLSAAQNSYRSDAAAGAPRQLQLRVRRFDPAP